MLVKSESERHPLRDFLVVLGVILLSKSLYFETYGGSILLIGFFFLLVLFVLPNVRNLKIDRNILLYAFSLLALILINLETNYRTLLVLIIRIIICIMVIHLISFKRFSNYFIKIILVLCVFSWFALFVIYFDLHSPLPILHQMYHVEGVTGREYRNFIFFGVDEGLIKYDILKASGIWWEPGAFQVFVNLAFILSILTNTVSVKRYMIFLITVLASFATAGMLGFAFLSIIYFRRNFNFGKNPILYLIPLVVVIVGSGVSPDIINKFVSLSGASRAMDMLVSLYLFSDNPFIGYGYGMQVQKAIPFAKEYLGYDDWFLIRPSGADGLTMFVAQVGILGLLFLYPFLVPKYASHMHLSDRLLIGLTLFLIFNTQNFTYHLIFTILTFYGLINNQNMIIQNRV